MIPCLYQGIIYEVPVFLLRQVENFVVAVPTKEIAYNIFGILQKGLHQPLKLLVILKMYDGLDIIQDNRFVKMTCATYIRKLLRGTAARNQHIKSDIITHET